MNFKEPLENVFDVESTEILVEHTMHGMIPAEDDYITTTVEAVNPEGPKDDAEDIGISAKIDDVYDKAIGAFEEQTAYIQVIDPRYAARNAEVAAQYLKIALDAAATRANVKRDKRRNGSGFIPFANNGTGNQNVIVADRNELLRIMNGTNKD
jgi:hypothetical protein